MKTDKLKYFVGKVCSVFTTPHSRDLYRENPKDLGIVFRYFVGEILSVDEEGIMLRKMSKDIRTFVARDHIVAVAEEEVLDPNNPQDAKAIQEMIDTRNKVHQQVEAAKQNPELARQIMTSNPFAGATMNVTNLNKLAEEVKNKFAPATSR